MTQPLISVGALAAEAGVGVETIRFYQRRGLVPLPRGRHAARGTIRAMRSIASGSSKRPKGGASACRRCLTVVVYHRKGVADLLRQGAVVVVS